MTKLSSNPKVSVIMSVYNAEQTLREAIDSILKQTYTNWEFVICDDCSVESRFEKQVDYLLSHPESMVVGTTMRRFDSNGLHDVVKIPEYPDKNLLKKGVPFCHATIMMRKEAYDAVNGYKESNMTIRSQDYDMWFRFYKCGFEGYNMQEPLYLVREDVNAIKRRTFNNRLNIMRIQFNGFKLINAPWNWYFFPLIQFMKAFVPARLILLYRFVQTKK